MKEEDMYNYVIETGPTRTLSMMVVDRNLRCFRCDHTAESHDDEDGCDWAFMQNNIQYNCHCDVRLYEIMRQNKKGLEYTFDLLS